MLHHSCQHFELYDLVSSIDWEFLEPNLLQRRQTSKCVAFTQHAQNVVLNLVFVLAVKITEYRERLMAECWMRKRHY